LLEDSQEDQSINDKEDPLRGDMDYNNNNNNNEENGDGMNNNRIVHRRYMKEEDDIENSKSLKKGLWYFNLLLFEWNH
jgi:hypothetical protein